mgnify:FL=1
MSRLKQRVVGRIFSCVRIPPRCVAWGLSVLLMMLSGLQVGQARSDSHRGQGERRASVYDRAGDWTLHGLDGDEMAFSDCKGKMVFLNFWATWCKPCIAEMAAIRKLRKDMKDEDIVFLLVTPEREETVRVFLEKHPLKLPVYLSGEGAPKMFQPDKFPYTVIINAQGNIVFRRTGSMKWDKPACCDLIRGFMPDKES